MYVHGAVFPAVFGVRHILFVDMRDGDVTSILYKGMLAIMHALIKFGQYLVGNKFVVKIDHNNLRYFLTQKDQNERKQKWVSKIQAF